ncbi:MAG: tetratricopeptide repeat protein [Treponema sp.]|nr:tetratricopeptide repeat protein [Treponema sp.]
MADIFTEAVKLYGLRKYDESLRRLESILVSDGQDVDLDVIYYIGLCYVRISKPDEAMQFFEQIVTVCKDEKRCNQCRLILAVLYVQTGRFTLADYELRKLLQNGCQTVPVLTVLGYAAWAQKRTNEAVDWYAKALEIEPDNATALNGYGYVLACDSKDLTRALSLCRKALEISPESAAYLDSIAWVYYKLGLLKEAKSYIKKAKARNPKHDEILNHYRIIYEQMADNSRSSIQGR